MLETTPVRALSRIVSNVSPLAAAVVAGLAAPLLLRAALIVGTNSSPRLVDVRGVVADLGVGLAIACVLVLTQRLPFAALRWALVTVVVAIWVVVSYGNLEHVRALGTMASFAYVGFLADRTFLTGSALHVGQPLLLGSALAVSVLASWLALRRLGRLIAPLLMLVGSSAFALGAHTFWPETPDAPLWRQTNALIESVHWAGTQEQLRPSRSKIYGLFPGDSTGKPRVGLGKPGTNVILVILEGISGAYLDGVAKLHELKGKRPSLPTLDRWSQSTLTYANFVNHQRQTNRGLYALLCGDLDKLITSAPKMSEVGWSAQELPCLPNLLRKQGYETVFVQAAPLGFMNKDKFMPQAGFERVHGLEWFKRGRIFSQWGVDDKSFFEHTVKLLGELRSAEKPFFLAMLTAGTHHPFTVPEDFRSGHPPHSFSHAVAYLDEALEPFLQALDESGARNDTMIVFTSDESFGLEGDIDVDSMMLAQAWGYSMVSLPSGDRGVVREPFMQMDVARSIVDYLGYGESAGSLGGRSMLRSYDKARALPFGNTYMRMVAGINEKRELLTCLEDFSMCRKHALAKDALFAPLTRRVRSEPSEIEFVKRVAAHSLVVGQGDSQAREWVLSEPGRVPLPFFTRGLRHNIDVLGNQYLSIAKGQHVEVEIELELVGDKRGSCMLTQGLYGVPRDRMPNGVQYKQYVENDSEGFGKSTLGLRPKFMPDRSVLQEQRTMAKYGDRFRVHYSYVTETDYERVEATLKVLRDTGRPELQIIRAVLRTRPADPKSEQPGLVQLD